MEVNWGSIGGAATAIAAVMTVAGTLVKSAFGTRDEAITANKAAQKILFDKADSQVRELQEYKLHVAETYVNREVLREQLAPINESLKDIRRELQDRGSHSS